MGAVHNHMPLVVRLEYYAEWLNPDVQDDSRLLPILQPYAAEEMEDVPANDHVNNARHEGPDCRAETE